MLDLGTVKPGSTIYIPFHTFDSNDPSASVTITGLATTDIEVYKDGSVAQRASDSGYALLDTDGIDFDTTTGIHGISIDLADNTTAGFWASGSQYWVVIASITVDAATINFVAATFRIGLPSAVLNTTIATLSSQTSFTLTNGPAEDDALNGCTVYIHDVASAVQGGYAVVSDYTGSTKTVTLTAGVSYTAAATDNISVFPPTNVNWIQATAQTAGDIYSDTTIISSDTTAIHSDTTIIHSDTVVISSDTAAIHSDTTIIASDVVQVYSDTTILVSDTTAIHSDTTIIASDVVQIYSDTTAIYSDSTIIASDIVQVYSDTTILVSDTTAIHSDTTIIHSDTIIISSDTTAIHSQTTVIESDVTRLEQSIIVATGSLEGTPSSTVLQTDLAELTDDHYNNMIFMMTSGDEAGESRRISDYTGATGTVTLDTALSGAPTAAETFVIINSVSSGGSLTAAQDSKLTRVQSDMLIVESDIVQIYSDTTVIASDLVQIYSDTTIIASDVVQIYSDTTIIASDVVQIYSDTTAVHSDTTIISSDVVQIYSDSTIIASDVVQIYSDTTILVSDTTAIHSDTTIIHSDTIVISSDTTAIHSQTTVIESDTAVIESDTTVIESVTPPSRIAVAVTFTGGTTTTAVLGNVNGSAASSVDDYYNGAILVFDAGTLANQRTDITDYDGTTKTATITAVTTAVTSGHTAILV